MNNRPAHDRLSTHVHWPVNLLCYLLIIAVGLRRRYDLVSPFDLSILLVLLGIFTLLYTTVTLFPSRIRSYRWFYFVIQLAIVQTIGLFQEPQDTWAVLFIVLGFQVASYSTRRNAWAWFGLFIFSLMATLCIEFGVLSGVGRAMAYGVIGVLFISYDIQYSQHQDALAETQMLVSELQEAQRKLTEYASQRELLAALQERNRLISELYDSVGQKIFGIQLAAETSRLLLQKDPQRVSTQIAGLLAQTQSALSQVRQLIDQWRPD